LKSLFFKALINKLSVSDAHLSIRPWNPTRAHLDCLASEVRLNVDVDVALTVLANGCYRWLASRLHGFDKAKPKQLYRKFVETGGQLHVHADRLVVRFDKRAHHPILREAALDKGCLPIPWLRSLPVVFEYP
jgi:hypothetical protein